MLALFLSQAGFSQQAKVADVTRSAAEEVSGAYPESVLITHRGMTARFHHVHVLKVNEFELPVYKSLTGVQIDHSWWR